MPLNILALLTLEAVGLLVAIFIIMSLLQDKNKSLQKHITATVSERVESALTDELALLSTELKKITHTTEKTATELLKKHHQTLITESKEQLSQVLTTLSTELSHYILTQKAAVDEQLAAYKQQQLTELATKTDAAFKKLLERKVWRSLKSADQHTVSLAALDELLNSGELES